MKTQFIQMLQPGLEIQGEPFLVHDVARRKTRDGRPFILATLKDRTGQLGGVFWDVPPGIDAWVRPGLVVAVTGRVNSYRDALQIAMTGLAEATDVDLGDYLPASERPKAEMVAELERQIAALNTPWRELVHRLLLESPNAERFASAPAARGMHHAYIGGLLEHSLSMAALARTMAVHYPYVNEDLLVAGALLHDLGKIEEFSLADSFDYTEDGRLVGHIVRAVVMVEQAADALGFPEEMRRQLVHLIASHHGTHEWGSPVVPKTLEAVILHQLDLLDSRVQGFLDHIGNDSQADAWTARRSDMFGTVLQRPDGFGGDAADEIDVEPGAPDES